MFAPSPEPRGVEGQRPEPRNVDGSTSALGIDDGSAFATDGAAPAPQRVERPAGAVAQAATGVMVALLAGVALIAWATDGFAVLTTDAARARNVAQTPVSVPPVTVRNEHGAETPVLHDDWKDDTAAPRAIIVDFIYTRCITLCSALGGVYQQLQREIVAQGLESQVRLLSISFDVAHDSPERLARQARLMGARPNVWSFVTPTSEAGSDSLLKTFGVQVVPEGNGEWQHNAALHVVSADGLLVRIVDISDLAGALAIAARSATGGATGGATGSVSRSATGSVSRSATSDVLRNASDSERLPARAP